MLNSPKNPQASLQESLCSLQVILLVGSISAAVVFLFGIVFRP